MDLRNRLLDAADLPTAMQTKRPALTANSLLLSQPTFKMPKIESLTKANLENTLLQSSFGCLDRS